MEERKEIRPARFLDHYFMRAMSNKGRTMLFIDQVGLLVEKRRKRSVGGRMRNCFFKKITSEIFMREIESRHTYMTIITLEEKDKNDFKSFLCSVQNSLSAFF